MLERLEPDLLLVKKHIFYDVFIIILSKQSVSSSYVREARARSTTGKETHFL